MVTFYMQTRQIHVDRATFTNLATRKLVSPHFLGTIQPDDVPLLNPNSSINVGDQFIPTSNNKPLEKSNIPYHEVPFRIYGDHDKAQYLFPVNSDNTKIEVIQDITNSSNYCEICDNFSKNIIYISNEEAQKKE